MMAKVVVLSALIMITAAYKEFILKENKTPKDILIFQATSFDGTCSECKALINRFAEAIKDPRKVTELKDLLRVLCHETPYEDECRLLPTDWIVLPLSRCVLGGDSKKLLGKSRKGLQGIPSLFKSKNRAFPSNKCDLRKKNADEDSTRGLICEECQFAAQELKRAVEDEKTQQRLKRFISEEICSQLGSLRGKCDLLLEEFMPELIEELDRLLQNTKTFCADIGLCKRLVESLTVPEDEDINSQKGNSNNSLPIENSFVKSMNELMSGSVLKC
ncbi:hypothetical protein LOAG_12164 [Loa loa]|uniref:Saposin B-type domain-containing protein n=1 Tax=Loa loa TaxID=7209 RepID=A0A1S0TM91_LOALO|nr:hypothetical protein LOAG_12164 [Loa loa]EFO16345.1 hypothetical protein LOAG_12164 [Loa loa]